MIHKTKFKVLFQLSIIFLFISCVDVKNPYPAMAPGPYQGKLLLSDNPYKYLDEDAVRDARVAQFPGIQEDEVPFNFNIEYDENMKVNLIIYNADEEIVIKDISYGTEKSTAHDTFRAEFPEYHSYIYAEFSDDRMQGYFERTDKKNFRIPFIAEHGVTNRFSTSVVDASVDVSGNWDVTFQYENGDTYPVVGQFYQDGNHLQGTFTTEWGDYRYLEGRVTKDKMYLSVFDGIHVYLFGAKLVDDNRLEGFFKSGPTAILNWTAKKTEQSNLKNPDSISVAKEFSEDFFKSYPMLDNQTFALNEGIYNGKPKVVEIMGTWCPNCKDASRFLKEYKKNNPELPINYIGLSFEKEKNVRNALNRIKRYSDKNNLNFPIAFGGTIDDDTRNSLPWIDTIRSYPTLLFFDHNNNVRRVYTGFYGPATQEYEAFKESFVETIQELLKEYNNG